MSSWLGDRLQQGENLESLAKMLDAPSQDSGDNVSDAVSYVTAQPVKQETLAAASPSQVRSPESQIKEAQTEEPLVEETLQSMARWLGEGGFESDRFEPDDPNAANLQADSLDSDQANLARTERQDGLSGSGFDPGKREEKGLSQRFVSRRDPEENVRSPSERAESQFQEAIALPMLRLGGAPALNARASHHSEASPPSTASRSRSRIWFLGIDIGTSGISAVLLNRQTRRLYPLYWRVAPTPSEPLDAANTARRFTLDMTPSSLPGGDRWFRLPMRVLFDPKQEERSTQPSSSLPLEDLEQAIALTDLKPLLNLGIPHFSSHTGVWEPTVQWSSRHVVSLKAVQQGIQTLLTTLTRSSPGADAAVTAPVAATSAVEVSAAHDTGLVCGAVGLGDDQLQAALRNLSQVVLSVPSGWPDEYLLNLQDIVLRLDLVREESQIRWADEAIATMLSELEPADGLPIDMPPRLSPQQRTRQRQCRGLTLILNAGASMTHLAIARVPEQAADLKPQHFITQSVPYAGHALDQDIISQMLYPIWVQAISLTTKAKAIVSTRLGQGEVPLAVISSAEWHHLDLNQIKLPTPGRENLSDRHRFQQHLYGSAAGQQLLDLARLLKVALQHREEVVIVVDQVPYRFTRNALGDRVLIPYVRMLNQQIETLMQRFTQRWNQQSEATQTPDMAIQHIVCSGGTASLRILALWLRKQFPRATIVQDTYGPPSKLMMATADLRKARAAESNLWLYQARQLQTTPTCSRVAYGLALLPLHPALAEAVPRPYADYFLLSELLQVMPAQPLSLKSILAKLAQRGINIEFAQEQILALLRGELPAGLQSGGEYQTWLANPPRTNGVTLSNMTLTGTKLELFEQLKSQTYRVIPEYRVAFQRYLSTLFVSPEPLSQARSPSLLE